MIVTMPEFAYQRLVRGERMAGMFVVNDRVAIRQVIDELFVLINCSVQLEWKGVYYICLSETEFF
jgi:hypothetical protein